MTVRRARVNKYIQTVIIQLPISFMKWNEKGSNIYLAA